MVSLDQDQVRRAASALLKHIKSSAVKKSSLIEEEGEVVLAQISLHKIPENVSVKPIPIAIPHPLRQQEDCDMCLIVKDNAKEWIKKMMDNEPVEGLTKVRLSLTRDCHLLSLLAHYRSRFLALCPWREGRRAPITEVPQLSSINDSPFVCRGRSTKTPCCRLNGCHLQNPVRS